MQTKTKIAVMSIIVEDPSSVEPLNDLLHAYREWIIGRMGIPYRARKINVISIAMDAPEEVISELAGKVRALTGVSAEAAVSSVR